MDFAFMLEILPRLLKAAILTIEISLISLAIGLFLGIVLGILRVNSNKFVQAVIKLYVLIIRGTPSAIQIYAAYFLLPRVGIRLPINVIGVIALTINTVGYQIEIVRSALESIDKGQHEAAMSIGFGKWKTMIYVIVPQAAKRMIAPLTNELANLIKASSNLMIIAVYELTKAGYAIISSTFKYAEVLALVTILYLIMIQVITRISSYLERSAFTLATPSDSRKLGTLNYY